MAACSTPRVPIDREHLDKALPQQETHGAVVEVRRRVHEVDRVRGQLAQLAQNILPTRASGIPKLFEGWMVAGGLVDRDSQQGLGTRRHAALDLLATW
jgi:hypothetical protein